MVCKKARGRIQNGGRRLARGRIKNRGAAVVGGAAAAVMNSATIMGLKKGSSEEESEYFLGIL